MLLKSETTEDTVITNILTEMRETAFTDILLDIFMHYNPNKYNTTIIFQCP